MTQQTCIENSIGMLVLVFLQEEAEADYKLQFPTSLASPFDGLMDDDKDADMGDPEPPKPPAAGEEGEEGAEGEASEAQAKSTAARQLLDGELLSDIVHMHAAVFNALAARIGGPEAAATGAAAGGMEVVEGAVPAQATFKLSYQLGTDMLAALGPGCAPLPNLDLQVLLGREVDDATSTGHLYRLCMEHERLARMAHATAADAAAAAEAAAPTHARGGARKKGQVEEEAEGTELGSFDIQGSCVEEVVLLQDPIAGVARRLAQLLEEWPEHPVLDQLAQICARCLALPLTAPLKTALTGLELLLARAQVWEETAASHVTLKAQLGPVAALATRWRKLELASWRGTLRRVAAQHAAGANKSWFHLHLLLLQQAAPGAASAPWAAAAGGAGEATDGAAATAAAGAKTVAVAEDGAVWYKRTASTLEAFLQTSTLGEYCGRLQLLRSFHAHVQVGVHVVLMFLGCR